MKQNRQRKILWILLSITLGIVFLVLLILFFVKTEFVKQTPSVVRFLPGKVSTMNWKTYSSEHLGISFQYPQDWNVNEFSQDNGYSYILVLNSPDVKSTNTYKGGGIEIAIYFDQVLDKDISSEQYIKERKYTIPFFSETVYENGYYAIKFRVPEEQAKEGVSYFDIPYQDEIMHLDIRFTEVNRRQEAENIADAMINSLVAKPR